MPKRSSTVRDTSNSALVEQLVTTLSSGREETTGLSDEARHLIAVALGRQGGLKGGKARAKKLSPKTRTAIAKKAARARWNKHK